MAVRRESQWPVLATSPGIATVGYKKAQCPI